MSTPMRSLFRADAIRHYVENKEKVILPRLVSPTLFFYLWLLIGVLCASGLAVLLLIAAHR